MGGTASRTGEFSSVDDADTALEDPSDIPTPLNNSDRNNSSLANITTTEFVWSFGGHSVYVTGAWDNWRVKAPLSRSSPTDFAAVLALPVGTFQYKFIVDGNWKHNPALPTERDEHGNLNNIVIVKAQVPEYDSNTTFDDDHAPSSPIESYDWTILPQEDHSAEPPMVPRLLANVPFDTFRDSDVSGTNFVRVNHLFITNSDAAYGTNELRTIASETRYKSKIVTTVLIMAKNKTNSVMIPIPQPTRPNRTEPTPAGNRADPRSVQTVGVGESQSLIMDALNNV